MPPMDLRAKQPEHVTGKSIFNILLQTYPSHIVQDFRKPQAKGLMFNYFYSSSRAFQADRDAMFAYKGTIKGLAMENPKMKFNFTTVLEGVTKFNHHHGHIFTKNSDESDANVLRTSASNLVRLCQDAYSAKEHLKTGSRSPAWLAEVLQHIQLRREKGDDQVCDDEEKGRDPNEVSRDHTRNDPNEVSPNRKRNDPNEVSRDRKRGGPIEVSRDQPSTKKTRSLRFQLSSDQETEQKRPTTRRSKPPLLAIEDGKVEEDQDEEEKNDEVQSTWKYEWDDMKNMGKRMMPGTPWKLCHRQEADTASGFMKCFWKVGDTEEFWLSETTIADFEQIEGPVVRKKPAGRACKRPAASSMQNEKKKAYSRKYHQTVKESIEAGFSQDDSKKRGRAAAKKYADKMFPNL